MTHGLMEDLNAAKAAAPHQRQPDQVLVASPFLPTLQQPRSDAPVCGAHGPGISKRLNSTGRIELGGARHEASARRALLARRRSRRLRAAAAARPVTLRGSGVGWGTSVSWAPWRS
jgi:hypothetical protein